MQSRVASENHDKKSKTIIKSLIRNCIDAGVRDAFPESQPKSSWLPESLSIEVMTLKNEKVGVRVEAASYNIKGTFEKQDCFTALASPKHFFLQSAKLTKLIFSQQNFSRTRAILTNIWV